MHTSSFSLIVTTALLSLIIVIPVYTLTFYIAWKYREGNTRPNTDRTTTTAAQLRSSGGCVAAGPDFGVWLL